LGSGFWPKTPNPKSPIPNPQSPIKKELLIQYLIKNKKKKFIYLLLNILNISF